MKAPSKDIEFSHSFLSYLLAGLQGEFASMNILAQLGAELPEEEKANSLQNELAQTNEWFAKTMGGEPLFELKWEAPRTEEAKLALESGRRLAEELSHRAFDLATILSQKQFNEITGNRLVLLLAALGRHTYARDNYLRCFFQFHKTFGNHADANRLRTGTKASEQDIEIVNRFITAAQQNSEPSLEFYHALFGEVVALPGLLRTQAFDLRVLTAIYDGAFTYTAGGISEEHAIQWEQLGLPPQEAGHWEAYGMAPEMALAWLQGGMTEAAVAGMWFSWRFPPEEAAAWSAQDFTPKEAADWANAGYSPEESRQLINRGVSHPSLIRE
jgi:hypothetical protein